MGFSKVNPKAAKGFNNPVSQGMLNTAQVPIITEANYSKIVAIGYGGGNSIVLNNPTDKLAQYQSGSFFAGSNITVSNITNANSPGDNIVFFSGTNRTGAGSGVSSAPTSLSVSGGATNNILMHTGTPGNISLSNTGVISLGSVVSAGAIPGNTSVGIGLIHQASGSNAVAIGVSTVSSSTNTVAVGSTVTASNTSSIGLGNSANSSGTYSIAIGNAAAAGYDGSISIGKSTGSSGGSAVGSIAIGSYAMSGQTNSITFNAQNGSSYNPVAQTPGEILFCTGSSMGGGPYSLHSTMRWGTTSSATPITLGGGASGVDTPTNYVPFNGNTAGVYTYNIAARNSTNTDYAAWTLQVGGFKAGTAASMVIGTPVITTLLASAGAVSGSWAVNAVADTTNGRINLQVTGAAGVTIYWSATLHYHYAGQYGG